MAVARCTVGESDGRMVTFVDEQMYAPKGNFVIELTHEVDAGEKSGYLCEIVLFTGERLG